MIFDGLQFQRFIIVLLVIFIVISLIRKAGKFACFCISILCLMQVGFILSQTSVNDRIPLSNYFKYDVVKSITSIWNETDKEALKENISKGINTGADITEETIYTASDIAKKYLNEREQKKEQQQTTDTSDTSNTSDDLTERLP